MGVVISSCQTLNIGICENIRSIPEIYHRELEKKSSASKPLLVSPSSFDVPHPHTRTHKVETCIKFCGICHKTQRKQKNTSPFRPHQKTLCSKNGVLWIGHGLFFTAKQIKSLLPSKKPGAQGFQLENCSHDLEKHPVKISRLGFTSEDLGVKIAIKVQKSKKKLG